MSATWLSRGSTPARRGRALRVRRARQRQATTWRHEMAPQDGAIWCMAMSKFIDIYFLFKLVYGAIFMFYKNGAIKRHVAIAPFLAPYGAIAI